MHHITVTISRRGQPRQTFSGLFRSTSDAVAAALDLAGGVPCSISARVAA